LIYRKGSLKLYLTVDAELTASGTVYFARKQWDKEEAFLPEGRFGDVVECSRLSNGVEGMINPAGDDRSAKNTGCVCLQEIVK
jgi:hypothetical protein